MISETDAKALYDEIENILQIPGNEEHSGWQIPIKQFVVTSTQSLGINDELEAYPLRDSHDCSIVVSESDREEALRLIIESNLKEHWGGYRFSVCGI